MAIDPFAQIIFGGLWASKGGPRKAVDFGECGHPACTGLEINQRLGYWLSPPWGGNCLRSRTWSTPHAAPRCCASSNKSSFPIRRADMPSADKRAAYALEHIAFRVARIEQSLSRIAAAIEALVPKA